jgi:sirohydrochlorin cobaltochelatase
VLQAIPGKDRKDGFPPGISEVKCPNPLEEVMKIGVIFSALAIFLLPGAAMARNSDKAIMLTVFGTSTEASVTFDELLPMVQQRFPGRDVVVPYTSGVIRNKLNAEIADPAKKILSPAEMLEKLKADGYTDIAVISTLLFPGVEHDKLKDAVDKFSAANKNIKVAYVMPLLSEPGALKSAVGVLEKYMLKGGSNVVVAHGTHAGHPVEKTYLALADQVASRYPDARVGSIEGVPDMKETLKWLEDRKEENARFIVFMFVAGDHAENDIASDEDDSLFSAARAMGKSPSVQWVDTTNGKRIASLGLDPDYRALLLDYFGKNISQ